MAGHHVDRKVEELARRQHGAFSFEQALAAGATQSMIKARLGTGAWRRVAPGVYALAGVPHSWYRELMAATLTRRRAVVSGRAAAALHELTGFRRCRPEITVPSSVNARAKLFTVRRSSHYFGLAKTVVRRIPVTTVAETLVSVAAVVPRERLEAALDDALVGRLVRPTEFDPVLARYDRFPGAPALRSLLEERAGGWVPPASELERALYSLLDMPGIPPYVRQASFPWSPSGPEQVDALIPVWALIAEGDGRRWHSRLRDFERDRDRDNQALAHGYRTMRFTYQMLMHDRQRSYELLLQAGGARPA
ncbi:MAG: type IV toxin-antitoxin system AbiEi family antitoxin domain-containing protein [Acidimicrobiia bacterium]